MELVKRAKAAGWQSRKLQYSGRRNAMDRMFFGHGRLVLMEIKRPGGKPRPGQARELQRIWDSGYHDVWVCDSVEHGLSILGIQ